MKISVVIPSYNSGVQLQSCLMSLCHQMLSGDDSYEVLVIDDGSTDGTEDLIGQVKTNYELSYRFLPRCEASSRARARNIGLANATGDIVVFLDADQIVTPDFLQKHLAMHRMASDMAVIGMRTLLDNQPVDFAFFKDGFDRLRLPPVCCGDPRFDLMLSLSENAGEFFGIWHLFHSCNVSVRRETALRIGGFSQEFKGWGLEDSEFGYRLHLSQVKFAFLLDEISFDQYQPFSIQRRHEEFQANLDRFIQKHNVLEVQAQRVFGLALDPTAERRWADCYLAFERCIRTQSLSDSHPKQVRVLQLSERVSRAQIDEVLAEFAGSLLLIADETADLCNSTLIQLAAVRSNVMYWSVNAKYYPAYDGRAAFERKKMLFRRGFDLKEFGFTNYRATA